MVWLLLVLLAGPAQTISGKYARHSVEYLRRFPELRPPLPDPLPRDADALCSLIEKGHRTARLFAALGDALLARGDRGLAYRAYRRAHRLAPDDPEFGREMLRRMKRCGPPVAEATILAEEREAEAWVAAYQRWERERLARGARISEADLGEFYARYGRPEDDLRAFVRRRRISWVAGVGGLLLGLGFLVVARRTARRLAVLPLLGAVVCLGAYLGAGREPLALLGALGAVAGGGAVALLGRRVHSRAPAS